MRIIYYINPQSREIYSSQIELDIRSEFRYPVCQDLSEYLLTIGHQLLVVCFPDGFYKNPDFRVLPNCIQGIIKEMSLREIQDSNVGMTSGYEVLVLSKGYPRVSSANACGKYVFCKSRKHPLSELSVLADPDNLSVTYLNTRLGVDIYQSEDALCDTESCSFQDYIDASVRSLREFQSCKGIRI